MLFSDFKKKFMNVLLTFINSLLFVISTKFNLIYSFYNIFKHEEGVLDTINNKIINHTKFNFS